MASARRNGDISAKIFVSRCVQNYAGGPPIKSTPCLSNCTIRNVSAVKGIFMKFSTEGNSNTTYEHFATET